MQPMGLCATMYLQVLRPRPTESRSPIFPCWAALSRLCRSNAIADVVLNTTARGHLHRVCGSARKPGGRQTSLPTPLRTGSSQPTSNMRPVELRARRIRFQSDTAVSVLLLLLVLLLVPCRAGALLFLLLLQRVVLSFALLLWGKCFLDVAAGGDVLFVLWARTGRSVTCWFAGTSIAKQKNQKKTQTAKNNIPPIQHKYFGSSRHQSINTSSVHGNDDQSNAGSGKSMFVL